MAWENNDGASKTGDVRGVGAQGLCRCRAWAGPGRGQARAAGVEEQAVFRASLIFPLVAGANFDLTAFCSRYLPDLRQRLGSRCIRIALERCLVVGDEEWLDDDELIGVQVVIVHLYFESEAGMRVALGAMPEDLTVLLPECTDIVPLLQLADTRL